MAFIDLENLRRGVDALAQKRILNEQNVLPVLFKHLTEELSWGSQNPRFIRCYAYTGEYTDHLITKIKKQAESSQSALKPYYDELIERCQNGFAAQKNFIHKSSRHNFFELKTKPLQYLFPRKVFDVGRVIQKGVDVQIAVDLVHHAFNNSYDVALLCSGDKDLLESIKLVKTLGKKVIIISHHKQMADALRKEADYYKSIADLPTEIVDAIAPQVS